MIFFIAVAFESSFFTENQAANIVRVNHEARCAGQCISTYQCRAFKAENLPNGTLSCTVYSSTELLASEPVFHRQYPFPTKQSKFQQIGNYISGGAEVHILFHILDPSLK